MVTKIIPNADEVDMSPYISSVMKHTYGIFYKTERKPHPHDVDWLDWDEVERKEKCTTKRGDIEYKECGTFGLDRMLEMQRSLTLPVSTVIGRARFEELRRVEEDRYIRSISMYGASIDRMYYMDMESIVSGVGMAFDGKLL